MNFLSGLWGEVENGTWSRYLFSIILIVSVALGLGIGMIRGIIPLISIFISVFIAGQFYEGWAGDLSPFLKTVVFFLVFISTFIVVNIFGLKLYTFLTARHHLGWIDRIGGAVLGLMGGLIFRGMGEQADRKIRIDLDILRNSYNLS